jgi:hypothetical protein
MSRRLFDTSLMPDPYIHSNTSSGFIEAAFGSAG